MLKSEVVQKEKEKLQKLFTEVESSRRQLVESLIESAAFYAGENYELRQLLSKTGMVKAHPDRPDVQKTIPAAEQIRKNDNVLANIIKALYTVLRQNVTEEDDRLGEYE